VPFLTLLIHRCRQYDIIAKYEMSSGRNSSPDVGQEIVSFVNTHNFVEMQSLFSSAFRERSPSFPGILGTPSLSNIFWHLWKKAVNLGSKYNLGTSYIKDRNTFVTCYQLGDLAAYITTQYTPSDYRYVPFKNVAFYWKKKKIRGRQTDGLQYTSHKQVKEAG
jgi:hypothetical protein